jgi:hypothetical protein
MIERYGKRSRVVRYGFESLLWVKINMIGENLIKQNIMDKVFMP